MTKHALVTGGTSGIGHGIAKKLVKDGYSVSVNGLIDANDVEPFLTKLQEYGPGKVRFASANLTSASAIEEMILQANREFGPISVLINNAGVQHVSPIEDFAPSKWDTIIAINLTSAFHTTRLVVPAMKEFGWGRIINLASAHGLVASPYKSAYVAAKHGLLGLTKTVALELAKHGITCNSICPGYVKTPLVEAQIPDTAKARGMSEQEVIEKILLAAQPTGQFVSIEEIADTVAFLLSKAAANITGAAISIDGGWTAQ